MNVVCVNWGTKYGLPYTQRLYNMVHRHTNYPINFYVLTDRVWEYMDSPAKPILLKPGLEGWWNKMRLFQPGLLPPGEYLYLDLDVVIVDNIDCFFKHEGFGITRDFIRPDNGIVPGKEYNSSVMRFESPNEGLWKHFNRNKGKWAEYSKHCHFFGDQNVISDWLNLCNYKNPFPDEWCWSYKKGVERGKHAGDRSRHFGDTIPNGGKICVFHGLPNPGDVDTQWVKENWV